MAPTHSYLAERLQTLNEYCTICDEPHTFGSFAQADCRGGGARCAC